MKIPLKWLQDYVSVSLSVAELVDRLTVSGLEVGGVELLGIPVPEGLKRKGDLSSIVWDRDKVLLAKVLETSKHPNADRLKLVRVEYGADEPKVVVTGAGNIAPGDAGQTVVLALTGTTLYDGHAEGKVLMTLKPTKIRGIPSDSMLCSERELGLAEDHEGIILLDEEILPGTPLVDVMGDAVLEVDVLPNMARCLSLIGIAREASALTGQPVQLPMRKPLKLGEPIGSQVAVRIEETRLCRRYQALLIRDVKPGPAPGWMQRRLRLVGTRPIDAIVDITNYVLFEWGQPLHAFDYDRLVARAGGTAPTIVVRLARPGEKLATLDGKERELTAEMLVIADTVGPIALAGVMGGLDTMVTTSTKNLLLESASFDPVNIRRTARALDLHSESSYRFSRGVHPEVVQPAAERAAALLSQFAGGTVCQGVVEQYPSPLPPQQIDLSLSQVERVLGIPIPAETAAKVLRSLEFGVNIAGDVLNVTTPPSRLDIQDGPADLIEELARIHGYDHLPATLLSDRLPRQQTNRSLVLEEQTRDILVAAGLTEVMSYSLTLPEREKPILGERSYLTLANPVSSDRSVLRQSVLASILEQTARNLKHREQVKIFEIGQVYEPLAGEKLPRESCRLAVVLVGPRQAETWSEPGVRAGLDFFDLKGVLETFLQELHIPQSSFRAAKPSFLHPGRAAELQGENISFGFLGQLHPALNEIYELGKREIYVADLDLDALLAQVPMRYKYEPIAEFPPVRQDVALVVDENIEAAKLEAEIRAGGGDLLKRVRLFDVYRGDNLPVGTKSLAFALTYQAHDRTLTDKEVAKIHGKIVNRLEHKLGAKLRT